MNRITSTIGNTWAGAAIGGAGLLLAACAVDAVNDPGASRARAALTELESNSSLASRAPLAIHDAETAVQEAEQPQTDATVAAHLVYIADRRVQTARAQAQTKLDEDQRQALSDQNGKIQLDARTREADAAKAKNGDLQAQTDAAKLKNDALQAKPTDRGMVLTLGDVLFSSGRSDLKPGGVANLDRLASFLGQAPDRNVRIEGHTDDRGSQSMNQALSQKRAEAVALYVSGHGVASGRITSVGEGYNSPVADNATEAGRQANRRVEVIIQNSSL